MIAPSDETILYQQLIHLFAVSAGDASYFDFKINNTIYKIVNQRFAKDEGEKFCKTLMGVNATLLHLGNKDEYDFLDTELRLRYSSSSDQFWLNGDPTVWTYSYVTAELHS